ncbi:hypothetical protein [Pseudorhizobium marinum]|uniref:hypothetical protein n=1 Tax=Pseudorhizobium marinum TaxID=1496690 RepID=UPI0004984865|nr:hypothetical protein [Pseudorhizobium marinum]
MDEDNSSIDEGTEQLRATLLEKLGRSNRPATVGELAEIYAYMLLMNDVVSELFDLGASDDLEEKINAMQRLRPLILAINKNFADAVKKTVKMQTDSSTTEGGQSGES